jgi:hypothetical protein
MSGLGAGGADPTGATSVAMKGVHDLVDDGLICFTLNYTGFDANTSLPVNPLNATQAATPKASPQVKATSDAVTASAVDAAAAAYVKAPTYRSSGDYQQ